MVVAIVIGRRSRALVANGVTYEVVMLIPSFDRSFSDCHLVSIGSMKDSEEYGVPVIHKLFYVAVDGEAPIKEVSVIQSSCLSRGSLVLGERRFNNGRDQS